MDQKVSGIYAILSIETGKIYVGSSVALRSRWLTHRGNLRRGIHNNKALQRSWDAHGESAHLFYLLEITPPPELLAREQEWIDRLDATNPIRGYNGKPVAASMLGYKHRPESLEKMRAAKIGKHRPFSAEHRANLSASRKGRKFKPCSKKHIAAMRRGHALRRRRGGTQLEFKFWKS